MAYLMERGFDNSCRLARKTYLFQYRDTIFKLVQDNPRKWADHLLTIVSAHNSIEADRAFAAACEFVSALGWEHHSQVAVWETGGRGWHDTNPLRPAKPSIFTFPRVAFGGNTVNCDLHRLPHVQTEEQRIALALYREAGAANTPYLKFFFYWQVMEVGRGTDAVGFVNRAWSRDRRHLRLQQSPVDALPLQGRSLGNYLLDDCRNAIAHIKRKPGRTGLNLDVRDERGRLAKSTWVVQAFAQHYIRTRLALTEYVYLMRPRARGVPRFVDIHTLRTGRFRRAYASPNLRRLFR
jgi:Methylamine utilization protein MauJ